MPIFVYRCACGTTFERLVSRDAAAPDCPDCGGATRKIPARPSVGRRTGAPGDPSGVPAPWQGTVAGGPERMQREVQLRQKMTAKAAEHPGNPGAPAKRDPA